MRPSCLKLHYLSCCRVPADYDRIPDLGRSDVCDAVHHILYFALDLLTAGRNDTQVDREYIHSLHWYRTLPKVLASLTAGSTAQQHSAYPPHYEEDYAEAVMVFNME